MRTHCSIAETFVTTFFCVFLQSAFSVCRPLPKPETTRLAVLNQNDSSFAGCSGHKTFETSDSRFTCDESGV
jgi:hypothetical protein